MNPARAVSIEDLHRMAKRRLPKIAFDFIEGGCDDELGLAVNESSYARYRLVPRYLVDVSKRSQATTLFGQTYASPFGIAPTGIVGLFRPGGDLLLAEAAKGANIPFIQSGSSTSTIEAVAKAAPENAWYQLFQPRKLEVADDFVRRARDAGVRTLVLTVDAQGPVNHERNVRNGFSTPLKMTVATVLESLLHPGWLAGYLKTGMPVMEDWRRYAEPNTPPAEMAKFVVSQGRAAQTWRDVEHFRKSWPGNFVIKGILHPDDARRAVQCGVDGIIVSNHGGRRLDRAPHPVEVLPLVRAAVGPDVVLMCDSGIRRGSDIITALCLGADFCFVGRATLYGVAAGGLAGAQRALAILRAEVDVQMAQIGCSGVADLGPQILLARPSSGLAFGETPPVAPPVTVAAVR